LILIVATLIISPCFGIGSSLFGKKIVETTGSEIIAIGPLGATLISCLTATILIMVSLIKGIPTSLVQLNTAAIVALGIVKYGWREMLKHEVLKKVWFVWIIAPILSLVLSYLLLHTCDSMGLV
jgi:sulfate permease